MPRILIASAARAPQFRRNHVPPPAPSREAFLEELRRLQGIPPEVLCDPALMRAILPALEADATLYRNYVYAEDAPLPCPIRAYGGADDPNVRREHLEAWAEQTTASFAVRVFPGGHFYLTKARGAFLRALEGTWHVNPGEIHVWRVRLDRGRHRRPPRRKRSRAARFATPTCAAATCARTPPCAPSSPA